MHIATLIFLTFVSSFVYFFQVITNIFEKQKQKIQIKKKYIQKQTQKKQNEKQKSQQKCSKCNNLIQKRICLNKSEGERLDRRGSSSRGEAIRKTDLQADQDQEHVSVGTFPNRPSKTDTYTLLPSICDHY